VLHHEVPGHLVNGLQAALWQEAVHLVAEDHASVADVDLAITTGLGARWAVCGPHEIFHLAGGAEGLAGFLARLGPAVEEWRAGLGSPQLDAATCAKLLQGVADAARGGSLEQTAAARDAGVLAVLAAVQGLRSRPETRP
jgi:carnitine 3-dehydrogenase